MTQCGCRETFHTRDKLKWETADVQTDRCCATRLLINETYLTPHTLQSASWWPGTVKRNIYCCPCFKFYISSCSTNRTERHSSSSSSSSTCLLRRLLSRSSERRAALRSACRKITLYVFAHPVMSGASAAWQAQHLLLDQLIFNITEHVWYNWTCLIQLNMFNITKHVWYNWTCLI